METMLYDYFTKTIKDEFQMSSNVNLEKEARRWTCLKDVDISWPFTIVVGCSTC